MKKLKILLWLLLGLFLLIILLGNLLNEHQYQSKVKVQGTAAKAYKYMASHQWKPLIFNDIRADYTTIEEYNTGHVSTIGYGIDEVTICTEKIVELVPNVLIHSILDCPKMRIDSRITFEEQFKSVNLIIDENIIINSYFLAPIFLIDSQSLHYTRDLYYQKMKSLIESRPDEEIEPKDIL